MKLLHLWVLPLVAMMAGCAAPPEQVYNQPLISPGGQFAKLPPAAQNSIRAQAGAAEIDYISKHRHGDAFIYIVHFKNAAIFPPLYVAPDGSVLNPDLTVAVGASLDTIELATGAGSNSIKLEDLPANVVRTIRSREPTAEVDSIRRISISNEVYYDVFFKDPEEHPGLFIADDGRLVR